MAASTFKRLEAHLLGTQKLLATLHGQPCLGTVAQGQCSTFISSLQGVSLAVEHASVLNELVVKTQWPSSLSSQILQAIAERTSTAPALGSMRSKLQNFEHLFQYLTMEQWHCLSDRRVSHEGKLDLLVDLAIGLGLRCPTEPSVQLLATLHTMSCHGPEQIKFLAFDEKLQALRSTKRVFKRKISGLPTPVNYIANLPSSTAAFKAEFPQVYACLYKTSEPVASPIPESLLRELQHSFPMRCTKKAALPAAQMGDVSGMMQQVLQMAGRALGMVGFGGGCSSSSSSNDSLRIQMLSPARLDRPLLQDLPQQPASLQPAPALQQELTPAVVQPILAAPAPVAKAKKPSVEEVTQDILKGLADKAAEAAQKAKSKNKAKAEAKGKSKAQPKPKAKGQVKLPITKLGCSKCRYAQNGCSECKQRLAKAQGKA